MNLHKYARPTYDQTQNVELIYRTISDSISTIHRESDINRATCLKN